MSTTNKGSAGSTFELTPQTDRTLVARTLPPETATLIHPPISGAVASSPKSAEILMGNPEFLYDGSDRVDGVSWANSGTVVGSDLTYVDEPVQDEHIHFPGTAGNSLQVPDSAALDMAGATQVEIVVRMAADWHHETRRQAIIAKRGGGGQSYELVLLGGGVGASNCGMLMFKTASTVTDAAAVCKYPVPFMPYETGWIKVTWSTSDNKVHYYVANDKATEPVGDEWMEIGSVLGLAQVSSAALVANTEAVHIGGIPAVGATAALAGRIYYLAIRDAIGGTEILEIDVPTDTAAMTPDVTTTFTATSGQTVTVNKSGTPPNTCRLHNTLNVTLPYPWYEVALPTELEVAPEECLLVWLQMNGTTASTPDTRFPLVSIMGIRNNYFPGYGVWYSLDTNKVGTFLSNESGFLTGSNNSVSWSTALGTGSQGVFMWVNRMASTDPLRHAATLGVHNGAVDFGGINAYWAVMPSGMSEPDSTYFKLRIIAPEIAPIDISQVGFKVVTDNPPLPVYESQATAWDNTIRDYGRALAAQEAVWDAGDAFYITDSGTPAWLGDPVLEGNWLVAETLGSDSTVVWDNHIGTGRAWIMPFHAEMSLGGELTLDENDNSLFWIVVSRTNDGVYRNLIRGFDTTTEAFINLGVQFTEGAPFLYGEIDSASQFQSGEIDNSNAPDWVLPGTWADPVIFGMWLERTAPAENDRIWLYASGLDNWMELTDEATYKPGTLVFSGTTTILEDTGGIAIWGFGVDLDCGDPTTNDMDQILSDVIVLNSQ